jgi:putative addiction module component (TIGR02574 family)
MSSVDQVLNDALLLPADARASLALEILTSLDPIGEEENVDQAWATEISRRLDSIRQGKSVLSDWDDALERIRTSILSKGEI